MLQKVAFGPNPTVEHVKNYLISHIFLEKLELYHQFALLDKVRGKQVTQDDQGRLLINIQDYSFFKNLGVRSYFSNLIS